jgi:hypothetical protein
MGFKEGVKRFGRAAALMSALSGNAKKPMPRVLDLTFHKIE